jgi:hypothetical protein
LRRRMSNSNIFMPPSEPKSMRRKPRPPVSSSKLGLSGDRIIPR